jgi:FKBP-type peptidyl-prolyl cis-trans isomerase
MKKSIIFLCLFFTVFILHAKGIQEDQKNADEKARLSYAFGMVIGSNFGFNQMDIEFDYTAFAEGLKAILEGGQTPFSEREAMEIIEAALYNAEEKQNSRNRLQENEFFASNGQRQEIQTTESGLQYEVIQSTEGEKPNNNSVVRVIYNGTFTDGRVFDSSTEEGGAYIPLEHVIPGWTEGLMLMSPGSIYRLYIPSNLAYGKDGIQGVIPPYSTLIFLVELLEIIEDSEEEEF